MVSLVEVVEREILGGWKNWGWLGWLGWLEWLEWMEWLEVDGDFSTGER